MSCSNVDEMETFSRGEHGFRGDGFLYWMDARVKAVAFIGLTVMAAFGQSAVSTVGILMGAMLLTCIAGPAWRSVLARVAAGIPFGGLIIVAIPFVTPGTALVQVQSGWLSIALTAEGVEKATTAGLRLVCCLWLMSLMLATTDLRALMQALESFRVPRLLTAVGEFGLRYMQLLLEESGRMQRAGRSRGFAPRNIWDGFAVRTWATMVGNLFLRSMDRSERVYWAMMSRGYSGIVPRSHMFPPLRAADVATGGLMLAYGIFCSTIGWFH